MGQALSVGGDAGCAQRRAELGARPVCAAGERPREGRLRALEGPGVERELAVPSGRARHQPRRHQRQHPVQVGGGDQLPGPAHDVRAQHAAVGQGGGQRVRGRRRATGPAEPQSHRPPRRQRLLGLQGAHPGHQLGWFAERPARDLLRRQSLGRDGGRGGTSGGRYGGAHRLVFIACAG